MSEAAGVNSAGGSFGLSFGLAFAGAIMLATLTFTFTDAARSSDVLSPSDQDRVAEALEQDAQVMENSRLNELVGDQPEPVREEIIRINTETRPRALQVALLVPLIAAMIGVVVGARMTRHPDPEPSGDEPMVVGG